MIRVVADEDGPSLGTGSYTTLVIFAGFFIILSVLANALSFGLSTPKLTHLWANQFGFLLLVALYLTWIFRVGRGTTSATTGGGFGIAASALVLRAACELTLGLAGGSLAAPTEKSAVAAEWVSVARNAGLVAYVWGLGLVAAALLVGDTTRPRSHR